MVKYVISIDLKDSRLLPLLDDFTVYQKNGITREVNQLEPPYPNFITDENLTFTCVYNGKVIPDRIQEVLKEIDKEAIAYSITKREW